MLLREECSYSSPNGKVSGWSMELLPAQPPSPPPPCRSLPCPVGWQSPENAPFRWACRFVSVTVAAACLPGAVLSAVRASQSLWKPAPQGDFPSAPRERGPRRREVRGGGQRSRLRDHRAGMEAQGHVALGRGRDHCCPHGGCGSFPQGPPVTPPPAAAWVLGGVVFAMSQPQLPTRCQGP